MDTIGTKMREEVYQLFWSLLDEAV
jgi:hypothetical protein